MTARVDTAAILARAEAATAGPWGATTMSVYWPRLGDVVGGIEDLSEANAEFIAAARSDIPALCRRVNELEAALRDVLDNDCYHPENLPEGDERCRRARVILEGT